MAETDFHFLDGVMLGVLVAVFVVWAVYVTVALRSLIPLTRARKYEMGGGFFAGHSAAFVIYWQFATRPEHRLKRNRSLMLTVAVFAVIALHYFWTTSLRGVVLGD